MKYLITLLLLCIALPIWSNPDARLFHIERSKNKNIVCYDINLKNGQLDTQAPCNVYWLRLQTTGEKKELNYIERKMAYGYKVTSTGKNGATIQLAAYPEILIHICQHEQQWVVKTTLNGQEALLEKIYVQADPKNSLKVQYLDVTGTSLATGQKIAQRIKNLQSNSSFRP